MKRPNDTLVLKQFIADLKPLLPSFDRPSVLDPTTSSPPIPAAVPQEGRFGLFRGCVVDVSLTVGTPPCPISPTDADLHAKSLFELAVEEVRVFGSEIGNGLPTQKIPRRLFPVRFFVQGNSRLFARLNSTLADQSSKNASNCFLCACSPGFRTND